MKVYLASWFASRADMQTRAAQLREAGIEVTSRWLEEGVKPDSQIADLGDIYLRETARVDVEDVIPANFVVLNTPSAEDLKNTPITLATWARGGRHFEAGFQYAMMVFFNYLPHHVTKLGHRGLVLVGHRENVFHYLDGVGDLRAMGFKLPEIPVYPTWEEAKDYLIWLSKNSPQFAAAGR